MRAAVAHRRAAGVFAGVTLAATSAAPVQAVAGVPMDGGLYWHVSAPQGASWSLVCHFTPLKVQLSRYDRDAIVNRITRQGKGLMPGRLPGDNGRCTLTKTGGDGPVAISLVKNGVATADATIDPARPAAIGVF